MADSENSAVEDCERDVCAAADEQVHMKSFAKAMQGAQNYGNKEAALMLSPNGRSCHRVTESASHCQRSGAHATRNPEAKRHCQMNLTMTPRNPSKKPHTGTA